MFLYLVQHAEAKREEEDPARPLSERGIQEATRVARHLARLPLPLAGIIHSQKLRARQTAELLFHHLKPLKGIREVDGLSPLDDPALWASRLESGSEDLMVVGHLPHLGRLAGLLLCGNASRQVIHFRMAGVVCLKRDGEDGWGIQWMVTPDIVPGEAAAGQACDSL